MKTLALSLSLMADFTYFLVSLVFAISTFGCIFIETTLQDHAILAGIVLILMRQEDAKKCEKTQ